MDPVYSVFIILALVWIGLVLCGVVKSLQQILDLKKEERNVRFAEYQTKIQRDNANLALQNDLRGFIRLIAKNFYPQKKKTDKKKKKKTKETK